MITGTPSVWKMVVRAAPPTSSTLRRRSSSNAGHVSSRRPNEATMKRRGDEEELEETSKGCGKRSVPLSHLRRWLAGVAATRWPKGWSRAQGGRLCGQAAWKEGWEHSRAFKHTRGCGTSPVELAGDGGRRWRRWPEASSCGNGGHGKLWDHSESHKGTLGISLGSRILTREALVGCVQ